MLFLTLLSYIALVVQVIFATIGVAAGLYYLAELVEEYTTLAKKIIWWLNFSILIIYIMLGIFEDFSSTMVVFGIMAQICHFLILRNFPFVSFLSVGFILGSLLMIVNHYLAFTYFTAVYHPFVEVLAYFTLCLWIVPFGLFVSLSANDNVLPTSTEKKDDDIVSRYLSKRNTKSSLLSFFNYMKEILSTMRPKKIFKPL